MGLIKRYKWICDHMRDKDVLDVGCAGRDFSLHRDLVENGHAKSLLGIDINPEGIAEMRKLGLNVECHDAERYISPEKFDVIIMSKSISHLNNVGMALDCAYKNLRDDGRLVIATDNARFLGFVLKEQIGDDHNFIWSPGIMSYLLSRHGFKTIKTQFFDYRSDRPNLVGRIYEGVFIKLFPSFTKGGRIILPP